ncbi:MAG TPA: hypothetical protein VN702_12805 [Acetobacteraceae bacterium]|nr:hypothetical protein [Acetobacteraceae bacterium]
MRPFFNLRLPAMLFLPVLLPVVASPSRAQTLVPTAAAHAAATAIATPAPRKTLTGKERLGEKWTDEQRINNCKVPADKRGTTPRPAACASVPAS